MRRQPLFQTFLASLVLSGCGIIRESKYQFTDGVYDSKLYNKASSKVYVESKEEAIHVYLIKKSNGQYVSDSSIVKPAVFFNAQPGTISLQPKFSRKSFDIDFLTIPFKYRFPVNKFPRQFNTNLNGGIYLGYRNDTYVLHYSANPLGVSKRNTTHFAFSCGIYNGLGGTTMNPWVTSNQIAIEYDGVVWTRGLVGIIGFNNFSAGLAIGWDLLLDEHQKLWIYQDKPWVGFAFGLNLN